MDVVEELLTVFTICIIAVSLMFFISMIREHSNKKKNEADDRKQA